MSIFSRNRSDEGRARPQGAQDGARRITSRLHRLRFPFKLTLIVAATAFLAACGEASLLNMVEGDQGGEFSLNEQEVHLQSGGEFTLHAQGGIKPYTFELEQEVGTLESSTGRYAAPEAFENGTVIDVPVNVSDYAGETASALFRLYERLSVTPRSFEIEAASGDTQEITVSGGVPDYELEFEFDESRLTEDDGSITYKAPDSGDPETESFRVYDSIGNRITVNVEVFTVDTLRLETVPAGESLTVDLGSGESQTLTFTVTGGIEPYDDPHVTSGSDNIGSLSSSGFEGSESDEFTYTVDSPGTATIEVTDDDGAGETVSRTVVAFDEEPEELSLTPSSVTLSEGGNVEFTASGGVPPYEFEVDHDAQNTVEQVSEDSYEFTLSGDLPKPFQDRTWEISVTDAQGQSSSSNVHTSSN
ncbi:MAG: hypothetical protein R6V29_01005 [Spirochaetia bacterium]